MAKQAYCSIHYRNVKTNKISLCHPGMSKNAAEKFVKAYGKVGNFVTFTKPLIVVPKAISDPITGICMFGT
jgi:hypothetical protein